LSGYQPLGTFIHAGYSPNAITRLVASGYYPTSYAPENVARSLAYVRDVMGRRLEDNPLVLLRRGVPRAVAPRYTALHKVYVWCGGGAGKRFAGAGAVLKGFSLDEGAQCNGRQTAHPHILVPHRHGAALDDMTNVHKNTGIMDSDDRFLKYGRITREAYDEVRRLTVPRFVVLWEEGELLPLPDVALVCRPCLNTARVRAGLCRVVMDLSSNERR
jgi:hypothetical protein